MKDETQLAIRSHFNPVASIASAQIHVQKKSIFSDKSQDVIVVPQIAKNTRSGDTLVYWTNYLHAKLYARLVNAKGKTNYGPARSD